ncbi:hypothetical protein [Pseudoclavibacter sp. VKM Ac-2888]|uniref:hypothetical protein n=1 Tax=Pseudoclavibacter sp. VKM Ac-2888 TaxID=2783830 RepID=UPI00188B5FB5|nr:hypothetical protein [Pseudoclavibacter sp. VKM Ac-2888]MBF4549493.1 hypothetical protein [Pseudoclavibacter sp. VKM Ac-2888]
MSDNESTPKAPDATTDTEPQPQLHFAAIRVDPLTNETIVSTEEDWNYGTAALVADTLGGEVYARAVGPWVRVVPADTNEEGEAGPETGEEAGRG